MAHDELSTGWSWKTLENLLGILPSHDPYYTSEQILQVETVLKQTLPPSYIECVQRWGPGVAFGLFIVWTPAGIPTCDLGRNAPVGRRLIQQNIEMGLWDSAYSDLLLRLLPFGASENGDMLCWDTQEVLPNGEMSIRLLESEQNSAPCVGNSLLSFFGDYCVNGKLDEVFPVGQGKKWGLPHTFRSIR